MMSSFVKFVASDASFPGLVRATLQPRGGHWIRLALKCRASQAGAAAELRRLGDAKKQRVRDLELQLQIEAWAGWRRESTRSVAPGRLSGRSCLLYTSDAADE